MKRIVYNYFVLSICLASIAGCEDSLIQQSHWGNVDGKEVFLYSIQNDNGMEMKITNYGGIITSITVPDRSGNFEDVVLGFDNLQQYIEPNPCFGATIGRFANRIRDAKFTIDDQVYELVKNDGDQCLHGGNEFDRVVWDATILEDEESRGVELAYVSPDGTNGFPGQLKVKTRYLLTENNAVKVTFQATTNKPTHVNMTQHSYFNLAGTDKLIYDHIIKIDADYYTEIDSLVVPTGDLGSVAGLDLDLRQPTRMGDQIKKFNKNGYHFCYVFNKPANELKKVIEVYEPNSGRTLEVTTTQPSVQFYSGNAISKELVGKSGVQYGPHSAFCLETQHLPNTPNISNFPSTLLRPNEVYEETVIYSFGIKAD